MTETKELVNAVQQYFEQHGCAVEVVEKADAVLSVRDESGNLISRVVLGLGLSDIHPQTLKAKLKSWQLAEKMKLDRPFENDRLVSRA